MEQQVYTINELIPKFRELNAVYTTVTERKNIVYPEQVLVTDFYKTFRDTTFFEKALIELMLATDGNKYNILTTTLQSEIANNISHFELYRDFFNSLDIYSVCRTNSSFYDNVIKDRIQATNEYGKELAELKNALDSAAWNGRNEEADILERKVKQVQPLYEEERKRLDALFLQQREAEKEAALYAHNRFADIYAVSKAMLSVLTSYTPTKKEADQKENNADIDHDITSTKKRTGKEENTITYFSMKLIAAIYEQSNGQQFENATETNYYSFFNLQNTESPLQIKSGEKTRVYYLLHKMYESLPYETKQHWRNAIFKLLAIDKSAYDSKYREPVSDIPAKKSKQFAEDIDNIFDDFGK